MKALYLTVLLAICTSVAAQGYRIVPTYPGTPYRDFSRNTYVIEQDGTTRIERRGLDDYDPVFQTPWSGHDGYGINYDGMYNDSGYSGRRDIRVEPYR